MLSRVQTVAKALALGLVLGLAGGWVLHAQLTRPDAGAIASADSLQEVVTASDERAGVRLEESARTVARATEHQVQAATHHDSAAALGQAAALLQDSLACTDTTLLRRLGELHAGQIAEHEKAYQELREAASLLRGELNYVQDTLLAERTTQRDEALRQLHLAVRRSAPASQLPLIVTAVSCATGGYAVAKGNTTVAAIGGGVCAVSLLEKPLRSLLPF